VKKMEKVRSLRGDFFDTHCTIMNDINNQSNPTRNLPTSVQTKATKNRTWFSQQRNGLGPFYAYRGPTESKY